MVVRSYVFEQQNIDRFWSSLNKKGDDECWEWLFAPDRDGYGVFRVNRIAYRAHRVAYSLKYNDIVDHLLVCHKCDNPPCCNPNHLFLGTASDNTKDMQNKKRCKYKYTDEQIKQVHNLRAEGMTYKEISLILMINKQIVRIIINDNYRGYIKPEVEYDKDKIVHYNRSRAAAQKLTRDKVKEIKILLLENKISQRQIAKKFNVCPALICNIKKGKTWASVTID